MLSEGAEMLSMAHPRTRTEPPTTTAATTMLHRSAHLEQRVIVVAFLLTCIAQVEVVTHGALKARPTNRHYSTRVALHVLVHSFARISRSTQLQHWMRGSVLSFRLARLAQIEVGADGALKANSHERVGATPITNDATMHSLRLASWQFLLSLLFRWEDERELTQEAWHGRTTVTHATSFETLNNGFHKHWKLVKESGKSIQKHGT
jgi:hypothetical protein